MPSSSGGEHLKIYGCILQLFMISLWKKAWSFNFKLTISSLSPLCREHGSSFEKKFGFSSLKDALCQVLMKLAHCFFNLCHCIFAISKLFPLEKGRGSSFVQTRIPITQGYIVPSLVEIGPMVLGKKMKM